MNKHPSRSVALPDTIADDDGFKVSIASAATPQSYTGAALDGAAGAARVTLTSGNRLAVLPSVTTAAHTGSYVAGSKVTFTGLDVNGVSKTATCTLTTANGGEVVVATQGLQSITKIDVEAQVDTSGAFKFGWAHVSCPGAMGLRAGGAGSVKLGFSDGGTDTIQALVASEKLELNFTTVYGDASSPATKVSLFIGD